jgi:oligopeptide/dipeptide ABC transporter ATP-binding protein
MAAIPRIGGRRDTDTFALEGEPPDAGKLPSGCRFRPRCPHAIAVCAEREPLLAGEKGHQTACHLADSIVPARP